MIITYGQTLCKHMYYLWYATVKNKSIHQTVENWLDMVISLMEQAQW